YAGGAARQKKESTAHNEVVPPPFGPARHSSQLRGRLVPGTCRPHIAALQACSMRGHYDLYQPEDDAEGEHLELKCHCCPVIDLRREQGIIALHQRGIDDTG